MSPGCPPSQADTSVSWSRESHPSGKHTHLLPVAVTCLVATMPHSDHGSISPVPSHSSDSESSSGHGSEPELESTYNIIFHCRWSLCRASFSSQKALTDHVRVHALSQQPVPRSKVSVFRQIEGDLIRNFMTELGMSRGDSESTKFWSRSADASSIAREITSSDHDADISSLVASNTHLSESNRPRPVDNQTLDPKMLTQPQAQSTQFYDLPSPTSSLPTQSQRSWYNTQPGGGNHDNDDDDDDDVSVRPSAVAETSNKTRSQETPVPVQQLAQLANTGAIAITTTVTTNPITIPPAVQGGTRPEGWRSGQLNISPPPPPPPPPPPRIHDLQNSSSPRSIPPLLTTGEDQTSQYLNLPSSSSERLHSQGENSQQNTGDVPMSLDPFELQTQAFYAYPSQPSFSDD